MVWIKRIKEGMLRRSAEDVLLFSIDKDTGRVVLQVQGGKEFDSVRRRSYG